MTWLWIVIAVCGYYFIGSVWYRLLDNELLGYMNNADKKMNAIVWPISWLILTVTAICLAIHEVFSTTPVKKFFGFVYRLPRKIGDKIYSGD